MLNILTLTVGVFSASAAVSATTVSTTVAQADDVQVAAYELDVRFEPDQGTLDGTALVFVDPDEVAGDHLTFYLHGELRVDGVFVGGKSVAVSSERVFYESDYSLIATRARFSVDGLDLGEGIAVRYSGPFHPSRARSPSDYMRIDRDGVHLRSFGYSLWFPVFLGPEADSHEVSFLLVRLDTPEEFVSVFTGTRFEETVSAGRRVSQWEATCDLFEAQCTARRFDVTESEGTHVYSLRDASSRAQVPAITGFVERFNALAREAYGRLPGSEQTHVVQMTAFGDIASGNTIGIAEGSWRGFGQTEWARSTLAHELIHAYVSVSIRRNDPLYALVVEGFPSYFHLPVLDSILGEGFLDRTMERIERDYLSRRDNGGPLPELALTAITPDRIGLYKDTFVLNDRALLFCHYLRRRMGTETFGELTRALFAVDRLDRSAFEALVAEHAPDLGEDLALWLDGTEFPDRFRIAG